MIFSANHRTYKSSYYGIFQAVSQFTKSFVARNTLDFFVVGSLSEIAVNGVKKVK